MYITRLISLFIAVTMISFIDASIEIIDLQTEHISIAKKIFTQVVHEFQLIPCATVHEAEIILKQMKEFEDYDDPKAVYFNNNGSFLVVLENNEVVGTGAIKRYTDTVCELKRMWFVPEARGKGLATALMHELITRAETNGYKKIYLQVYRPEVQTGALRLYQKFGFYEIPHYEETKALLAMERNL